MFLGTTTDDADVAIKVDDAVEQLRTHTGEWQDPTPRRVPDAGPPTAQPAWVLPATSVATTSFRDDSNESLLPPRAAPSAAPSLQFMGLGGPTDSSS